MFNRALGLVRPRDVDSELFDITYVQCGDASIEKKIEERIDHFCGWVEKHPARKGQVCLSFYNEKKSKQIWFSRQVERQYWEQWNVHLNVVKPGQDVAPEPQKQEFSAFTDSAGEIPFLFLLVFCGR
jgi:autophagy-related protein 101